jgi:hypothetical protein
MKYLQNKCYGGKISQHMPNGETAITNFYLRFDQPGIEPNIFHTLSSEHLPFGIRAPRQLEK